MSINYLKVFAFVEHFYFTFLRDSISSLMKSLIISIHNRLLRAKQLALPIVAHAPEIAALKLFNFSTDVRSCWLARETRTKTARYKCYISSRISLNQRSSCFPTCLTQDTFLFTLTTYVRFSMLVARQTTFVTIEYRGNILRKVYILYAVNASNKRCR